MFLFVGLTSEQSVILPHAILARLHFTAALTDNGTEKKILSVQATNDSAKKLQVIQMNQMKIGIKQSRVDAGLQL